MNRLLNTLGKKILIPTLALLILLLSALGVFVIQQNAATTERALRDRGEAMATFMEQVGKTFVATYNVQALDVMAKQARKDPDIVFAAFFDEKGTVMAASDEKEPTVDSTLIEFKRDFVDEDQRAMGSMKLYYSRQSALENIRREVVSISAGVVVLLAIFVVGLLLLTRSIVRPIRELTFVANEVVSKGDLRQEIRVRSTDEVGQLANSFREMVIKLRDALGSLQQSSQLLDTSVIRLGDATQDQNDSLERQSQALQETQTTAEEIKQTSTLASEKAEDVLRVMAEADRISQSGEAAVEQTLVGLSDIRDRVQEISDRIVRLNEKAQQIAGITGTVKDLADQSNILALNAAIEAVRSGEHGKGFGIVAREIRSLADQSIKATGQVREILGDIGTSIRDAVSITQTGTQRIENSLVQVRSSGESLKQLSAIVKDNSNAARQIASAVNQQNAGIVQIFAAMNDLSKLMDDSMQRLETTRTASSTVSEVSRNATQIVKGYIT